MTVRYTRGYVLTAALIAAAVFGALFALVWLLPMYL